MSKKAEKPVQFFLPLGGGAVNHCFFVSEDELEEKSPEDRLPALMEKALAGGLSARTISQHREELLREAVRSDRAEALARLVPAGRRMEPGRFLALFNLADESGSTEAAAWLLQYRRAHYRPAELEAYEERQIDLELGFAEPERDELRELFRLHYLRSGVCVCGVRKSRAAYHIPAMIGSKPVVGVDAAAFYAPEPLLRVSRELSAAPDRRALREAGPGERVLLGRCAEKKGAAETALAWRILRREEERSLLLCERPVALLPYHPEQREVTWADCRLRRWLNEVFLPLSMSAGERELLLPSVIHTPDNPHFGTPGGPESEDRLFLLSTEEAAELLPDDGARALGRWWWLRTPGFDNSFAAAVSPEGAVVRIGSFVDADDYAVRPAMWVKTE